MGWNWAANGRVYPRVCGGTCMGIAWRKLWAGLSPRVRGNHTIMGWQAGGLGSIPACAGEPIIAVQPEDAVAVYPRVCGGTTGAW